MNDNELMNVLKEHGQEHIYEAYQKLDEAGKAKLAAQVEKIDWSMVAMAGHEELAQERGKLEPLSALEVKDIEADKAKYEQVGIEAIKASKVGAVLLAGGQGTRLGSDGPKVSYLNATSLSGKRPYRLSLFYLLLSPLFFIAIKHPTHKYYI